MHARYALTTALLLLAMTAAFAAETPTAQALFDTALTGSFTKKKEMIAERDALLPMVDAALAGAQTEDKKKGMAVSLLILLAEGEPTPVFTRERVDTVSKFLLTSKDWGLRFAVGDFIAKAAKCGMLGDRKFVADRVRTGFQQQPELNLGLLLIDLAPTDPATLSAVRAGKDKVPGLDQRLLLAAAGDLLPLKALVEALALGDPTNDEPLHRQRMSAIVDLGRARDCRTVAALVEAMAKPWPLPARTASDVVDVPLFHLAMEAFTETLKVYPDIMPREKLPGTPKAVTEWWEKEGQKLAGLDIRKSTDRAWQRKLPGLDVPWVEPVLDPASPEAVRKRMARDQRDWERAADAIAAANPQGNALEFYRQATRGLDPSRQIIMTLSSKALANKLVEADYVQLQKLIADNASVLATAKKGLVCRKCEVPPLADARGALRFFPLMVGLQQLQLLEGVLIEHEGKVQDALVSYLNGIALARHISGSRLSVETGASFRAERNACQCISRTLATTKLPVAYYSWLCGKLQESGDSPMSLADTVDEEINVLRRSCEVMSMKELADEAAKGQTLSPAPQEALTPVKDFLVSLDAYQQEVHAWLRLSYREARSQPMPKPAHWIAQNWIPNPGALWVMKVRVVCDKRAILLAAAVLAYNSKVGKLPERLSDLTPDYVATVPPDPFTAEPFIFVRRPTGFRLYSVGPDLADDHGATPLQRNGTWEKPSPGDIIYDYDLPAR